MNTKHLFLNLTLAALCMLCAVSCKKEYENPSKSIVNAALKLNVSSVTATGATVSPVTAQDNITSVIYVSPQEYPSTVNYLDMDAVGRLDYIKEHGKEVSYPNEIAESNLEPGREYTIAAIGKDAAGKVRTAPVFTNFTTESVVTSVTAIFDGKIDDKYKFHYSMVPNDYVANFKYIISNDPTVCKMDEEALKAYIRKGGSDVKESKVAVNGTLELNTKADLMVAALSYDDLGREQAIAYELASTKALVYFVMDKKETKLQQVGEDEIYEGTFDVAAKTSFTIKINRDYYGFQSFSGNGGVGQIENMYSAMPYYYAKKFIDNNTHTNIHFYIRQALGRMEKDANEFWVNTKAAGKIYVRIDLTEEDLIPRYYIKVIEDKPNVVLDESFDLCAYGSYYMIAYNAASSTAYAKGASVKFSVYPDFDGTEAGVPSSANGTALGIIRSCWPDYMKTTATPEVPNAKYMNNKGLHDWEFLNFAELAGAVLLGQGNNAGHAVSPFLTKLSAPTDITVEYDFTGYGDNTAPFDLDIIGAGKFTSCEAVDQGAKKTIEVGSDKHIDIPEGTASHYATSSTAKKYTHIKATISGADATTRIKFGFDHVGYETRAGVSRAILDNVLITK